MSQKAFIYQGSLECSELCKNLVAKVPPQREIDSAGAGNPVNTLEIHEIRGATCIAILRNRAEIDDGIAIMLACRRINPVFADMTPTVSSP